MQKILKKILEKRKKTEKSDFLVMKGLNPGKECINMELTNEKLIETLVLISLMAEALAQKIMVMDEVIKKEAKKHGHTL